jgi:23S rRNA (cytidine2498-2'-O)-methyltransferase
MKRSGKARVEKTRTSKPRTESKRAAPSASKTKARVEKTRTSKPRTGKTRVEKTRTSKPRAGKTRADKTRADKPRVDNPRGDKTSPGKARRPSPDARTRPQAGGAAEPKAPAHTAYPKKPVAISHLRSDPHPGNWLFTTRAGSEQDLIDELLMAKVVDPAPRKLAPALVLSPKLPKREGRPMELTFARQGMELQQVVTSPDLDLAASRIARTFKGQLASSPLYALQVWVPDSPDGNPLSALADELDARLEQALAQSTPGLRRVDDTTLRRDASIKLAQVCVAESGLFMAGVMHGNRTPSLAKGGRTRVRLSGDLPSRAARKVEEALAWLGVAPGPGELCVDLGAAPGGWTYVLAERRARVIAVDPAKLRPDILARRNVQHVQESAFTFTPNEHVDWLFCDMAWRPLEVAALLAKWGRKRWARILVANIKLPMTRKAELLARVRAILEREGEWRHVRAKQLYHDRDEITLSALKA